MKTLLTTPRRFLLVRDIDTTGMSGTGIVAHGTRWHDGTASVLWLPPRPSVVFWYSTPDGMSDAEWIHTHGGTTNTRIEWLDWPDPEPGEPAVTIPADVFSELVKVAQYISVGSPMTDHPDRPFSGKARHALAHLKDAGLLPATCQATT